LEFRDEAASEFSPAEWPATKKIPSTNNTPIESFWRWQRNGEGHNIKQVIQQGAALGIFSPQEYLHKCVIQYYFNSSFLLIAFRNTFYWIFVPLVQRRLDDFRSYWNHHKLTGNSKKLNPYGSSPLNMLRNPQSVRPTARDCAIYVNPQTVYRLRASYGGEETRQAAYSFFSEEFQADADGVYVDLGSPTITLESAWDIFSMVVTALEQLPQYA
jgi:hypothetical protein